MNLKSYNIPAWVALVGLMVFNGCFQDIQVEEEPESFEELKVDNFHWKSHQDYQLDFIIPDYDLRKTIYVEVSSVNESFVKQKVLAEYLIPGNSFSKKINLPNHIHSVELYLKQGSKERTKVIQKQNIETLESVFLDNTLDKGDLQ